MSIFSSIWQGLTKVAANPYVQQTAASLLENRLQNSTNLSMYNRQRTDALADFNRQNTYASPKETMARYKEAGLNPHLIYGQQGTSATVRSTPLEAAKVNIKSPQEVNQATANIAQMLAQAKLIEASTENKKVDTQYKQDTLYDRTDLVHQQYLTADQKRQQETYNTYIQKKQTDAKLANILANTNLSYERKAQVKVVVDNLKTQHEILGYKVDTAKQEAEFVKKMQAIGIGGNLLLGLLKIVKSL
ncbi:MAG: DNA pilot protein [Microvirus sp.]|nr:MAG: DNA pilot protein [Microvirus sp.]